MRNIIEELLAGAFVLYLVMACLSVPLQIFTDIAFNDVLLIGAIAGVVVDTVLTIYIVGANRRRGKS